MTRYLWAGVVVVALLAALAWQNSRAWKREAEELQADVKTQAAVIALNVRINAAWGDITVALNQSNKAATQRQQAREVWLREQLKNETCRFKPVPDAIAGRLLDYATALRSRAMPAVTGGVIQLAADTAPARAMTYGQAVLWADALLSEVEKLFNRIDAIKDADTKRVEAWQN